jgi:HEPN domain-containing protein
MPPDRPEVLLHKAQQDELVLQKLLSDLEVDDDTLGFHAQQAAEKLLKALLAWRGVDYPKTHNLRVLMELLTASGVQLPDGLSEITPLTQFGTTFRYDNFEAAPQGERVRWLELIRSLRAFVEPLLR